MRINLEFLREHHGDEMAAFIKNMSDCGQITVLQDLLDCICAHNGINNRSLQTWHHYNRRLPNGQFVKE